MTKEQLIALGLTEELAQSVAKAWTAALDGYVPKADYDTLETAKGTLETQLGDYDKLLKGLVKDAKGSTLEEQINDFQLAIKTDKENLQKQLDETRFNHALEKALSASGAINPQALKGLLKLENIKLNNDGTVTGLAEQIKATQASDPYLFGEQEQPGTGSTGNFARHRSDTDDKTGLGERLGKLAAEPASNNPYFK